MKKFAQILIIALLLTGAGRVWALDLTFPDGSVIQNIDPTPEAILALRTNGGDKFLTPEVLQKNLDDLKTYLATLDPSTTKYNETQRDIAAIQSAKERITKGTEGNVYDPTGGGIPECSLTQLGNCILRTMAWLGQILVWLFSWLVWAANIIFNISINISVREFTQYANLPGVVGAWKICRNLVNISFIFVLLYVAIGTILRLDSVNGKKLLSKIIIAALLVNFSAFFTKIGIDASNVVANQFYTAAAGDRPLSFGAPDISSALTAADTNAFFSLKTAFHTTGSEFGGLWDQMGALLGSYFGQIVLMLVTTTVLLAGALMFLARTVVLIFIIVLSPLAFLGFAIGGELGKMASDWRKKLINQLIFAPVYLLLIYLTIQVVTSGGPDGLVGLVGTEAGLISSLVVFAIVNGLMIGSLLAAKNLGVAGAGAASGSLKALKKLGGSVAGGATFGMAGFAARNTLGRMSRAVADSERLKEAGTRSGVTGFLARTTLRAGSGVASSSFDARSTGVAKGLGLGKAGGKGGYDKNVKDKIENQKKVAELLVPGDPAKEKVADIDKQERVVADTKAEIAKIETGTIDPLNPQLAGAQKANVEALKAKLEKENIKLATLKKQKDDIETTGKERQRTYAENREAGGKWSTIFTGSTKSNRQKQARAIRAEAKKTKREKDEERWVKGLVKAIEKKDDKEEDKKDDKEEKPKE
ncbi:MAG: hypothetical protein AAB364_02900 [Patescibacteria group bacterium]